jgi:hypothetical protein
MCELRAPQSREIEEFAPSIHRSGGADAAECGREGRTSGKSLDNSQGVASQPSGSLAQALFSGLRVGFVSRIVTSAILLISADRLVDLVAMNGDFLGGLDAEADFIAADFDHDDGNVIVDDNTLVLLA